MNRTATAMISKDLDRNRRFPTSAGIAMAAVLVAGCGGPREEVQSYRVRKPEVLVAEHGQPTPPPRTAPAMAASVPSTPTRTLGAIAPRGARVWFFKLAGPVDAVAEHVDAFKALVRSVKFATADGPPTWTSPEGWHSHQAPAGSIALATIHVGSHDGDPLEVTVTPLALPEDPSTLVLQNVNRWRGQLGLADISADQVADHTEVIALAEGSATLVDLSSEARPDEGAETPPADGPLAEAAQPAAPADPAAPAAPAAAAPAAVDPAPADPAPADPATTAGESADRSLRYSIPAGWDTVAGSAISIAAFSVSSDQQRGQITVTRLNGDGGGELANVNRWRGQIGLGPLDAAQLVAATEKLDVAGQQVSYFRLIGPTPTAPDSAILAAIVPRGGQSFFVRLMGHGELAQREEARFRAFVQSLRF